ncbi:Nuclear receptor corepressor 2 [Acipenser ruthenus]|uniref:Nuclear receptor corepressor 2 n=1 Tax=Acipenser ruthenus TaxID=7906 RepID=A0A444V352_ACIRT|nr:Nuclear receptor corepressor 2 [Acipenser ruthenus]
MAAVVRFLMRRRVWLLLRRGRKTFRGDGKTLHIQTQGHFVWDGLSSPLACPVMSSCDVDGVPPPVPAATGGKPKGSGRSNSRKSKSPGPGLSGGERPSSVSSVHSEGDCNRRTPLTNRVWEDRPSSAGSTPFPCNPLTMQLPTGLVPGPSTIQQGSASGPNRVWDEEPKPLLCSQYETLSDSE